MAKHIPTTDEILAIKGSVPVDVAARYLGVTKNFIYLSMQNQLIPIGTACKGEREWMYDIRPLALVEYNQHGGTVQIDKLQTFMVEFMKRYIKTA